MWPLMMMSISSVRLSELNTVTIINVHPLLGKGGGPRQTVQEDHVKVAVDTFLAAASPAVLMGDFNVAMPSTATDESEKYCCQETLERIVRAPGVIDVFNPRNLTNNSYPVTRIWSGSKVDHMFVKGFSVRSAQVHQWLYSDHYPISAVLQQV
jgi:endonuclease/exonuclease/phosphatase family metal-dependent hydrolase